MTYNRQDIAVQVNIKSIKGYTMKEIGALDDRIRRLEYYTVLNALSLDTKTLSIRSPDGKYERLKNGIFADPFNDHSLGRVEDPEYHIAVDSTQSIARPAFSETYNGYRVNFTGSGFKIKGRIGLIDYDDEQVIANPYATTYRNCTESYYSFKGILNLYPNYDNYTNVSQAAPQVINVDLASGFSNLLANNKLKTQDISTVSASPVQIDKQGSTNYWSQTTSTTVSDITVQSTVLKNDLGDLVTDVSTLPYMRSRLISIAAYGLKPNTKLFCYFDNVNVTQYCAPAAINPLYADVNGNLDPTKLGTLHAGDEDQALVRTGAFTNNNTLPVVTSDSKGQAFIQLQLPDNTFRTGDRTILLTNVNDLTATGAILTTATGTYTASSLSVTKKNVSFNIIQPSFSTTSVTTSTASNYTTQDPPPPDPGNYYGRDHGSGGGGNNDYNYGGNWGNYGEFGEASVGNYGHDDPEGGSDSDDPVAETFQISTNSNANVPGFFVTGVGVFFKSKSATLGATMHVCQTLAGVPDATKQVARARLNAADIGVSDDSSVETIFYFDTPALIQTNIDYAFYIVPDGNNADYEIWISEVGGTDKLTSRAVTQQPYPGIMWVSSNGKSWTSVQSSDIKFNIYRASFKYGSAQIVFRNEPNDFISLNNLLRANTATAIALGDVVYAANTANTKQIYTDTTKYPFGIVYQIDELNQKVVISRSNGLFSNTTFPVLKFLRVSQIGNTQQLIESNIIASANVSTIDDIYYHGVVPKFTTTEPAGTTTTLTYYGTANNTYGYAYDSTGTNVFKESLHLFSDYERVIKSYSNEVALGGYGANGTSTVTVSMFTNQKYLSPVVDMATKTGNFIKNLISANNYNEETRYGGALNKYISIPVQMSIDAEDLLVYITGYRPAGTDILVYGKFQNKADNANFDDIPWTQMFLSKTQSSQFNSPKDTQDYSEYIYYVPTGSTESQQTYAFLDPTTSPPNILSYYSLLGGAELNRYNTFMIKIILLSNDPIKIPTMRDVRALALMK